MKPTKKISEDQLSFNRELLIQKKFTIQQLVKSKLDKLAKHLDELTHSDVVWLSRVEDFFFQNEYLSQRQVEVIDSIIKRHCIVV